MSERHGRALLKLPDDELRRVALDKAIHNNLNVNSIENLVEDILDNLRKKDEKAYKQNIKSLVSVRIYLNTIKKAYKAIKENGINAEYGEEDKGEFVLVTIKVPKHHNKMFHVNVPRGTSLLFACATKNMFFFDIESL